MADSDGPGVERFWNEIERGLEPDLADLSRLFPDETLALAQAMQQAAQQAGARTRERMWETRNRLLVEQGNKVSLGASLRAKRVALRLSEEALARRLSEEGVQIVSDAVRLLEQDRLSPIRVRPAHVWAAVARVLSFDAAQLMSLLELAAGQPRGAQQFARMERGSSTEDREAFLTSVHTEDDTAGAAARRYLEDVRRILGLPSPRSHPHQESVLLQGDEDD
jgi:hypothetical protein